MTLPKPVAEKPQEPSATSNVDVSNFLCHLWSIAAHRDHFVQHLSVCLSVSHTFTYLLITSLHVYYLILPWNLQGTFIIKCWLVSGIHMNLMHIKLHTCFTYEMFNTCEKHMFNIYLNTCVTPIYSLTDIYVIHIHMKYIWAGPSEKGLWLFWRNSSKWCRWLNIWRQTRSCATCGIDVVEK